MMIRCLLLFITFFSFVLATEAQPPPIEWQKSYGGSGIDVAQAMDETSDCGFIIAGYSNSTDGDVTGQHGKSDFWLCKLKQDGSLEWQKTYGGSSDDIAYSVKQTSDGGFIAVGFTVSNDGDVTGFHGGLQLLSIPPDLWVIKTDASGQLQWQKSLGGKGKDIGYSIELTPDGGYIITGEANENDGDVSGYHTGTLFPYTPDLWVVKLNSSGSIEWQKCFGSYFVELGRSIKPTSDGGYIVTGYVITTSPDTGDVKGIHNPSSGAIRPDVWVLKLSALGTIEWQKCLGGYGGDVGYDIIESSKGGYIVVASSNSVDGDVLGGDVVYHYMWLVKLNYTGNIEWQRIYNEHPSIQARNFTEDDNGNFTIGIWATYPEGDTRGLADYMIMKTGPTGIPIWEKTFGGPGNDASNMALPTKDNGYILCGSSSENGNDVSGNRGLADFWVVKLNSLPIITITTSAQNTCNGVPVVFTASVANGGSTHNYQWLLNGNKIGVDTNQIILSSLKHNDTITCILSISDICSVITDTSNSIIMDISEEAQPTISITANSNKICSGDTAQFIANVNNTGTNTSYQWQLNNVNIGTNSPQFTSTALKNHDTISCVLTTTGNCGTNQKIVSNRIVINVTPLVQTSVSIMASADSICKGNLVTFNSTAINTGFNGTYQWQLNGQPVGNNEAKLALITLNNGDKVSLIVSTDTSCALNKNPVSNIVTINYKAVAPPVNLGPDKRICFGTSTTINSNFSFDKYAWQNGSSANNFVATVPGLYWLKVEDACGNLSSDSVSIDFFEHTKNLLPNDTAICNYESIELKSAIPLQFYKWNNFEQSSFISVNKPGIYWLSGNDKNGCPASDSISITLKECINGFYIPNAFTPNRDYKNDKFRPLLFGEIEKYEFKIFNRWGELVFQSKNIAEGWDGRFKGIDQPSNTFVWQCIFQFRNETTVYKKGTVVLMR